MNERVELTPELVDEMNLLEFWEDNDSAFRHIWILSELRVQAPPNGTFQRLAWSEAEGQSDCKRGL